MGVIKKRIFFHHADTSVLGGRFSSPVEGILPIQAPLSLAPSGGFGEAHSEHFSFHELISLRAAHTRVSGTYSPETRSWTTAATATIEGLNIMDIVTVDRLVAHIVSEHPEEREEYEPTVSVVGSIFEGLKISGKNVDVELDYDLLKHEPAAGASSSSGRKPLIESSHFLEKVRLQHKQAVEQHRRALERGVESASANDEEGRGWVEQRYSPDDLDAKMDQRGVVLCSVVKGIKGAFPAVAYGNILEVPDLGRLFLGEMLVDHNSHRLIMLRAELGSPATGDASAGSVALEGRAWP